jgi:hypothetical protein
MNYKKRLSLYQWLVVCLQVQAKTTVIVILKKTIVKTIKNLVRMCLAVIAIAILQRSILLQNQYAKQAE